jgi:hypothetical protein
MFIKLTDIYNTEHRVNVNSIVKYKKDKVFLPNTYPNTSVECVSFFINRVTYEQRIHVNDKTIEEYDELIYNLINKKLKW